MMLFLHHFRPHHYSSFHLFIIGAILLCCLCQSADCFGIGRKGPPPPQKRKEDAADTERAMSRTLNKLSTDGDRDGRFVLLICKSKCLKERAEIPNWIREFNSLKNRSKVIVAKSSNESAIGGVDDSLGFHFHFYRKPVPVPDIEKALKTVGKQQAMAFYIVGGRAFPMNGQISKKDKFMKWLDKFEQPKIIVLADEEVDGWLNSECHGHENGVEMPAKKRTEEQVVLLLVHDPEFCPQPFLKNLARSLMNLPNSVVLEFRRPLTEDDDFIMHWRLHNIGENCQMHILLHGQYYLELDSEITGSELHQIVGNLTDNGNMTVGRGNCSASTLTLPFEMLKILPPLNPIEMEFLREERHLKAIEHNRQYLTVGAIGGVAVMALAMSIFWGLNGNDFVAKQARN